MRAGCRGCPCLTSGAERPIPPPGNDGGWYSEYTTPKTLLGKEEHADARAMGVQMVAPRDADGAEMADGAEDTEGDLEPGCAVAVAAGGR